MDLFGVVSYLNRVPLRQVHRFTRCWGACTLPWSTRSHLAAVWSFVVHAMLAKFPPMLGPEMTNDVTVTPMPDRGDGKAPEKVEMTRRETGTADRGNLASCGETVGL